MLQLTEMPNEKQFLAIYQIGKEIKSDTLKWFRDRLCILSDTDDGLEYIETSADYARKLYDERRAVFLVAD